MCRDSPARLPERFHDVCDTGDSSLSPTAGDDRIGTAGGQTKASTGYTFRFIQKQSEQIINTLLKEEQPWLFKNHSPKRFSWYDSTLLNILTHNKLPGSIIFTELFRKNKISDVLQFLDNETRFLQEMKIITVLPKGVFIKAAVKEWFKHYW